MSSSANAKPSDKKGAWAWTVRNWPLIKKILMWIFVGCVVVFLVMLAREVKWDEVVKAIHDTKWSVLGLASACALLSYMLYSTYDLVGKWYTRHELANWKVLSVCAISYAFNLSLGSFIGGVGFRYRLYSKLGLKNGVITRILGLSLATNWIGYCLLAGAIFASGLLQAPKGWEIGTGALRLIGGAMVLAGVAYIAMCGLSKRKKWTIKGHDIELPSFRIAVVQNALAIASWASIGCIIWILLEERADYWLVLGVFLLSGMAGALAHVPGGIGVIEAVFVAFLSPKIPSSQLIGALVVYRAIYYLAPLLIATVGYVALEASHRRANASVKAAEA
ncbi:YbhN family protein [Alcaligenaceae bacterium C4P045]|nr:YbhN family protein [Alcaligenaceae bacterium C4P045]